MTTVLSVPGPRAGDVVAGRFTIEREVAAGGMGRIFRAADRETGRPVALKTLLDPSPSANARFLAEAKILAELSHPAIVAYVAHGEAESGEPFLAMEWLDGAPLAARIAHGRLSVPEAIAIGVRVADGLAALHARGIIHRDLKPENVFLVGGAASDARLIDFGIARSVERGVDRLTRTGAILGTPFYMAPEQARGEHEIDARADVFALGCVLWECLAGEPAFQADSLIAVLARILLDDPADLRDVRSDVPDALAELVAAMVQKAPGDRPIEASQIARVLGTLDVARAPRSAPPPSIAIGDVERRFVCVVLAGSGTALADTLAADERAPDAIPRDEIARRAAELGATAHPLIDGSILIAIEGGAPPTDRAARAARLALALREQAPDLPLAIASGRATSPGRAPVGQVVDRAAMLRVSSVRSGDGIPIDADTAGLLGERFDHDKRDGARFLRGERHGVDLPHVLLGTPTACVGRERELGALAGILSACVDEATASAVLVIGPPGIGKSRVLSELLGRLRKRGDPFEVLYARADAVGAGAPLSLLAQAIRRAAGCIDTDTIEQRREKLRARITRHLAGQEADRTLAVIGELVGVPFDDLGGTWLRGLREDPIRLADAIAGAWETWLRAECAAQPVLLVLDDLHWGDRPTVRLVDRALGALDDAAFAVLGLARPEVHEVFPSLWDGRRVQEIALAPLSANAAERLVRAVLGARTDDATVRWTVSRADGNAFYLEELIRAVAEGAGARDLPDTVLGMLEARFDALDPAIKRVLRAASVFGETFTRDGVASLVGDASGAIDAAIDELAAREIVERRSGMHAFRHALVRDAAYATLTDADRALAHRLAAEHHERAGDGDSLVIAEHFMRAEDPRRATRWWVLASEHALEGNDLAGAVERAERGVASGAEGEELGNLRLVQAVAHRWSGRHREASEAALQALEWLPVGTVRWFRAIADAIVGSARMVELDKVLSLVERLRAAAATPGAEDARVIALARCVIPVATCSKVELADEVVREATALAKSLSSIGPIAVAQLGEAQALMAEQTGDVEPMLEAMDRALAAWEFAGEERDLGLCRAHGAWSVLEVDDVERADALARLSLETARKLGAPAAEVWAQSGLARTRLQAGDLDEAARLAIGALDGATAQGNARHQGFGALLAAEALIRIGNYDLARHYATRANVLTRGLIPVITRWTPAAVGRCLVELGETAQALEHVRAAARELQIRRFRAQLEGWIALWIAETMCLAGARDEARAVVASCASRLRERASSITREEWRRGFLREYHNAAVLRLADELAADP